MKPSALGALALCTQLAGCFVVIPGQAIGAVSDMISGESGQHCVKATTKVGDKVRDPRSGTLYVVTKVTEGPSSRCGNPEFPLRAEGAYAAETPAAAPAPRAATLPPPPPKEFTGAPATAAERAAACDTMNALKPGAPQADFQAAYAGLRRIGMTYRDCQDKPPT